MAATLRETVLYIFGRAGWFGVGSDTEGVQPPERVVSVDVFWRSDANAVPPVVVVWDRGPDKEPRQWLNGTWSRCGNQGDVMMSLRDVAEAAS